MQASIQNRNKGLSVQRSPSFKPISRTPPRYSRTSKAPQARVILRLTPDNCCWTTRAAPNKTCQAPDDHPGGPILSSIRYRVASDEGTEMEDGICHMAKE